MNVKRESGQGGEIEKGEEDVLRLESEYILDCLRVIFLMLNCIWRVRVVTNESKYSSMSSQF